MTQSGISSVQFRRDNCIFYGIGLKDIQKHLKQQKARLTNKSQLLFKQRSFLKNRISNDLSVETIRYSKRNWGKS